MIVVKHRNVSINGKVSLGFKLVISETQAHNYILPISCVSSKFLRLSGGLQQL